MTPTLRDKLAEDRFKTGAIPMTLLNYLEQIEKRAAGDNRLSHRARPDCEAAPWVVSEVKRLEGQSAKLLEMVRVAVEALKESDCTCGSESSCSDHSYKDGGCIRCEALTQLKEIAGKGL